MIRYKSSRQLSISEFKMPFEAKLDENNRWVILSKIVPWEEFARLYYKNFKSNRGAPTKDARLVLGVIIIKHIMKTDDRGDRDDPGESLHAVFSWSRSFHL
jgi:IS5 family transposase